MTNPPKNDTPDKALVEQIERLEETLGALEGHHGDGGIRITMTERRLFAKLLRDHIAALSQPQHGGLVEALPKQIGRLALSERFADGARMCSHGHYVVDGHPLYWPQLMGQFDDSDPYCLEHAIDLAESDSSWCQRCTAEDLSDDAALASNSPVVGEDAPAIPDGMKPWHGGDRAPDDWDKSRPVYLDWGKGEFELNYDDPEYLTWKHVSNPGEDQANIIAYSPKPTPTDTADRREAVAKWLCDEFDSAFFWDDNALSARVRDHWRTKADELIADYLIAGPPEGHKFAIGDRVTKRKGSSWQGRVVGFYGTTLTPIGYAVESERELGSVQIYPEAALVAARPGADA